MAVGAGFTGTSSVIRSNTGNDISIANLTVAFLVYVSVDSGTALEYMSVESPGGVGVDLNAYSDWSADNYGLSHAGGAFSFVAGAAAINQWRLVIWSKATGTTTPRLHYTNNGTTWTHIDGTGSLADFSGTVDAINLGDIPAFTPVSNTMEMAWAGIWGETTSDGQAETYFDYNVLAAKTNCQFFTGRSLLYAGTMRDASGVGNHETSRSGISAGTQTIPAWFINFEPASAPPPPVRGPGAVGPLSWQWTQGSGVDAPATVSTDLDVPLLYVPPAQAVYRM